MASNPRRGNSQQRQIPQPNVFNPNYGYLSYPPPSLTPLQPEHVPPVSDPAPTASTEHQTSNYPYQATQVTSQRQTEGRHQQYRRPVVSQAGGTFTGNVSTQQAAVDPHRSQTKSSSQAGATPFAHNPPQAHQAYNNPYHGYLYGQSSMYPPPIIPAHSHQPINQLHNFATTYNFQHPHSRTNQTGSYIGNTVPNYTPSTTWTPHEQYRYTSNANQFTTPGSYSQNYQTAPVNLVVNRSESAASINQSLSSNSGGFNYNNYEYHTDHIQNLPNVTSELTSGVAGLTPYTSQVPTSQSGIPLANNQQDYAPTTYNIQNSQQSPYLANVASETNPYRLQPTTSEYGMTGTTPTYSRTAYGRQSHQQPPHVANVASETNPYRLQPTTSEYGMTGTTPSYSRQNSQQSPYVANVASETTPYRLHPTTSEYGMTGTTPTYSRTAYGRQSHQQPPHVANVASETTPYRLQPMTSEYGMTATTPSYSRQNSSLPTNFRNESTPDGSGFTGMTPYMPPAVSSQSGMMPTNHQQGIPQAIYNSPNNQPFASEGRRRKTKNEPPQESDATDGSSRQNQRDIYYFTGAGAHGMAATEVSRDLNEEHRRAMAAYEDDRLKRLYLSEGFKRRVVINPNVNIEAEVNQEYLQQCLQGGEPEQTTMERLYGSVNINSGGQTHNFANFDLMKTYDGGGYHSSDNTNAIQHTNFMRPPPPYPLPYVNRLAIDSARDEARNAEAELTVSKERRLKVEEKIIAKEVGKRKMKSKSQRMSFNQREGYLRYQYAGRTTRNTQNYMNHSDEGLEEYIMQLELEEARAAEQKAAEKMRIANSKLKAQLDEASRIEAAKIQHHAPPSYSQNFNPVGPMRQPSNRRGRPLNPYQPPGRRSTAPGHEYDNSSAVLPQPPSYPSTSRANSRSQTYQAPFQMPNSKDNPPSYYQATASTPSEFRVQHPRQTASYGQKRKPGRPYKDANQNQQYPTEPSLYQRRQANREMPQMAAPTAGSQQHQWPPRSWNNAAPNSRGWTENTQTPVSNVYTAPEAYSGRQTRSSSRLWGGVGTAGPSGMTNPFGRPHFTTQTTPTYSGSGTQTKRRTGASSNPMNQPATTQLRKNASGTQSDQTDAHYTDNIENLVPTISAIPTGIFERCLNEMIHGAPEENQSGAKEKAETHESRSDTNAVEPPSSQPETGTPIVTAASTNEDAVSETRITESQLNNFLVNYEDVLTANPTYDDFQRELDEWIQAKSPVDDPNITPPPTPKTAVSGSNAQPSSGDLE